MILTVILTVIQVDNKYRDTRVGDSRVHGRFRLKEEVEEGSRRSHELSSSIDLLNINIQ